MNAAKKFLIDAFVTTMTD